MKFSNMFYLNISNSAQHSAEVLLACQEDQERAHPLFLQVDRFVLNFGRRENKKEPLDRL